MTIEQFIQKAGAGGWHSHNRHPDFEPVIRPTSDTRVFNIRWDHIANDSIPEKVFVYEILLDPLAWEAVGRVEGWSEGGIVVGGDRGQPEAIYNMHRMIDALTEGKTIEQFIETL